MWLPTVLSILLAGTQVVLRDGQVIDGVSVQRQGTEYLIVLESGETMTLPIEVVAEVRLEADGKKTEPEAPSGLLKAEPRVLAGPPELVELPTASDQTAVLGTPARFARGVFDPVFVPSSDWTFGPEKNEFNPARWYKSPIETSWTPRSAFRGDVDVLASSRSTWRPIIVDSTWYPKSGFWDRLSVLPEPASVAEAENSPPPAE